MIDIAIVDDDKEFANQIIDFIRKIEDSNFEFNIQYFSRPIDFINNYKPIYQILFLDVEMPLMDGFSVAEKVRKIDETTIIIFITKLAQYAIKGYEVNALDYIVKPFSIYDFQLKFKRALSIIKSKEDEGFMIHQKNGFIKLKVNNITHIEVNGHHCTFHTIDNEIYESYMTLSSVKEKLLRYHFLQCNGYCIVNPMHVTGMDNINVFIKNKSIPLSRPRKKQFKKELTEWLGEYRA